MPGTAPPSQGARTAGRPATRGTGLASETEKRGVGEGSEGEVGPSPRTLGVSQMAGLSLLPTPHTHQRQTVNATPSSGVELPPVKVP